MYDDKITTHLFNDRTRIEKQDKRSSFGQTQFSLCI